MTATTGVDLLLLSRASAAARVLAALAPETEAARRLTPPGVAALVDAGIFKLHAPSSVGGSDATLGTAFAVLEELGRADGAAGWCAMIGATSSLMSAFLDDATREEVFGQPDATASGVFAPMGRARRVPGGFVVTGRWPFGSGSTHAAWRMGGAMVQGDPEALPGGSPNVRCMLFSEAESRVIDTWDASGLRGSGSHDVEVTDVFVPERRSFSLLSDPPRLHGPVYRLPFFGVLAVSIAAVALGIARGAIDELVTLVQRTVPGVPGVLGGSKRTAAHRESVQLDLADAESKVRSARAFVLEAIAKVEVEVEQHAAGPVTLASRARLRLAACHATREAARAVDLMYEAGGATSVYAQSPLQRRFRDVHVATQHVMVGKPIAALAGRVLLGLEAGTEML